MRTVVTSMVSNAMQVAIHQCKSASSPHSYKFHQRTPLHHTPSIRLMDAAPLGVRGGRARGRREEASVKEMQREDGSCELRKAGDGSKCTTR